MIRWSIQDYILYNNKLNVLYSSMSIDDDEYRTSGESNGIIDSLVILHYKLK